MGSFASQRSTSMRCLTKTSCSPRVAIVFPTFDVGGNHGATYANSGFFEVKKKLRDYSKSEWEKFLYLDDPKVKVKSLGHARGIASNEFRNGSPRRGRPLVSNDSALSIRK